MTRMNLSMKQTQTDGHRQQTGGSQGGRAWGRMELETGVSRYQLLFMEWINNKVLLYSTQNYIQYPMINQKEKNFFNVHTCITELLCCTAEISTAL